MTRHLLFHWRRHHHHHNHHNFFLKNIWDWLPLKGKASISHHKECHTQLTTSHTLSLTISQSSFFCLSAPFLLLSAAPGFCPLLPDVSQSIFVTSLSFTFLQPFLSQESDTGVRSQMDISDEVQSILDKLNIARVRKCPTTQFWSVLETIKGSVMGSVCTMYSVQCTCHEVFRIAVWNYERSLTHPHWQLTKCKHRVARATKTKSTLYPVEQLQL